MATAQTRATDKYQKKMGIITKGFKMHKDLAREYEETCERLGVGQAETIRQFIKEFIEKNKI